MSAPPGPALRLVDVVKTFPGVVALDGVSFDVQPGEVHALVGENGAGKSTLMGVAAGAIVPDSGVVEIGGRLLGDASPTAAQALGLVVVYQHLSLLRDLTVTENMALAMPPDRQPSLAGAADWARERLALIGARIEPAARVSELTVADAQLLEIAKALALDARVVVLDEPTESLSAPDRERLFDQISALTARGSAVVYISHRLPEVRQVADRLTVLRDGATRGTFPAREASEDEILGRIVGRTVDRAFPPKRVGGREPNRLLEVRRLRGARFADIDVTLERGEILGLAGVEGNGQRDLLRALVGLEASRGDVAIEGRLLDLRSPSKAADAGVVYVPGDRHHEGLMLDLSVRENMSLQSLADVARAGIVRRRLEERVARREVEALTIRTQSTGTSVAALSGGNQQKVLLARTLLAEPVVLLADEPTRGVDAGARVAIYSLLRRVADQGRGVVVLSSDAIELQGLCDRVLVVSRGRIVRTLQGDDLTEANVTTAALNAAAASGPPAADARARRLPRFVSGDYMPALVVAALATVLAAYTQASGSLFLTDLSVANMLLLATALVCVSVGQLVVLLSGGIDLSVGPLTGLVVVAMSFFMSEGKAGAELALGAAAIVGVGVGVGLANGLLVRLGRLTPVLATLATFVILQGVSLLLRPEPGGYIHSDVTSGLKACVGPIPIAFLVIVAVAVAMEVLLRRTRFGLKLRSVGSDSVRAHQLGVDVARMQVAAYVICALFAAAGGVMLASQVGIGDPAVGANYTLTSITAVVLGGASIFGGRGSFLGALAGAILLQETVSSTTFLHLGSAWQYWLPGVLMLVAAALHSRLKGESR